MNTLCVFCSYYHCLVKFIFVIEYYGETSFNGYTRGVQHHNNYRSNSKKTQEKSALGRHAKEVHNDKKVEYKMEVLKTFKNNPLARQVLESVYIVKSKTEDDHPMNSKNEFNQAMVVTAKFTKHQKEFSIYHNKEMTFQIRIPKYQTIRTKQIHLIKSP